MIGSFGVVYRALNKITKEQRAIKFIIKSAVSRKDEVKLMTEINILKEIVLYHEILE